MVEPDLIAKMISENLKRSWVETDPSAECFDHSEDRMAALLDFLDDEAKNDRVREHLVNCPRCRYIYVRMRAET